MTDKIRGFQIVSAYEGKGIKLPGRKTGSSAGYDIEAAENVTLVPHKVVLVPTGLKAYMQNDEYLGIHVRSGISIKNSVSCVNSQGIIDADYYNNPENEGHIMVPLINHGEKNFFIAKGTRVAQGIFYKYLTVDGDSAGVGAERTGGFGSTGK
ncbi:dUTP pyrophosphatase [Anaerovibrio lipolyticus DSM 3074]|uniref:dUTP diphosphatase n=2 Tax=Anaerovibrio lipolyticus TaxID=82374 RepID=A0A0B2K5D1_9FIRM|nr:dUTP diphosphatase [Anaerovibrio lipolyticus]KHM53217.1 deoxyuridine 5'-triphosphate nucleotidohydrolase [Anaerovibrio lipolyticus]SHI98029.1 dUTP pyrophosphatase [Anaerovibrio lipolyticus DSM 3074]